MWSHWHALFIAITLLLEQTSVAEDSGMEINDNIAESNGEEDLENACASCKHPTDTGIAFFDGEEDPDEDCFVRKHPSGRSCKEKVEAIEQTMGLFDDKNLGQFAKRTIVEQMTKYATSLPGQLFPQNFAQQFENKLNEIHKASSSFGAEDVCHFLLSFTCPLEKSSH